MARYLYPIISIATFIFIWWLTNWSGLVNPLFVPSVEATFRSLAKLLAESGTYYSLLLTLLRAFGGLLCAAVLGIPCGLILAQHPKLYSFVEVPMEFLRAVPPSALIPLFMLVFGIGNSSKAAVVFYACSLVLMVNAFYGALPDPSKRERINMLQSFGATRLQIFWIAVFHDALPNIAAGFRVCLSYSLALVVVIEMFVGANEGLGKMIYDFYLQYRIPEMYSTIIVLGFTGFIANRVYSLFERRFIFWIPE